MDIRVRVREDDPSKEPKNLQGLSTGVLFACIAGTMIVLIVLGCLGHRRHKKRLLDKGVEHGS